MNLQKKKEWLYKKLKKVSSKKALQKPKNKDN